jgi:TonB-linked SusC/RagA family outer membrane protein
MKTKFNGILTLLLALVVQITFAQSKTISGTVSDDSGPLPGVSIIIKGTTTGAETDFDGNYSMSASTGDVLQYRFIGKETTEKTVGTSNSIDVTMTDDAMALDEIVVTALGIKREKKSLGFATTQVGGEEVSTAKEGNFVNSLSGKVAGLDITKSNTLGGSTNVILRGYTSLSGNNQALFVIDGTPVNNSNTNSSDQATGRGGYDYGNAAMDINPDDIESVNILKGAAASNLYGSRGQNGVIIITTKKGKKKEGIGVTVNTGVRMSTYDKDTFVKHQDEYGAGYSNYYYDAGGFNLQDIDGDGIEDLITPFGEDASFGQAFDPNVLVYQWDAFYPESPNYLTATPWIAGKNSASSVFQTGVALTTSVAIDGGTEDSSFRLGLTQAEQTGILPNSRLKRTTIDLSVTHDLSDRLTAGVKATYTRSGGKGRNGTGYDANNLMQSFRQWSQMNVDYEDQKDAYFATKRNITWNYKGDPNTATGVGPIYFDNPYWVLYENYETDSRDRILGNISLNYEVNDWLSILTRTSLDSYSEMQEERIAIGSVDVSKYSRFNRTFSEINYDLYLNFNKDLNDKLNLSGTLGATTFTRENESIYARTNGGLIVPRLYAISNSANTPLPDSESYWKSKKNGYFANAAFGYNNTLYVDLSARLDESSTLPAGNNTYAYWAASTSLIFSELMEEADWLSFGKFRANYGTVGNDASPGSVNDVYSNPTNFGSSPIYSVSGTKNNADLVNELTESYEVGLETKFFNNRGGLDVSYYNTSTTNQILPIAVTRATGNTFKVINAGQIDNKGIEVAAFAIPVKNDDFEWKISTNWAKNENEVVELVDGVDNYLLASVQGGITINATVGEPFGTIQGTNFTFLDGQRVIDATTGRYVVDNDPTSVLGNFNPEWKAGIQNSFKYKNLSMSFLIDIQKGGSFFSLDTYYGFGTGVYDITAGLNELGNPKRDDIADGGGILLEGVNPDGSTNTTRTRMDYYANALGWVRAPKALHVYDASFVKLREVTLGYTLPSEHLANLPINDLTFSLTGRNLWIIDKNAPYTDPESGLSSGNIRGNQSGASPSVKEYGFNIKMNF